MTDSENIKAFECCEANGGQSPQCDDCPYHYTDEKNDPCYIEVRREIFEILNRQQAEIERFKKIETTVNGFWEDIQKLAMFKDKEIPTLEELLEYMDNLKIEVIKEVAERLKEKADWCYMGNIKKLSYRISAKDLDNLVKEMVGDTE